MNRRLFLQSLGAAGVTAAGLGAVACSRESTPAGSGATASKDATRLTVGLTYTPDIQFAPFYVAAEKGYFDHEGLDVTLRHHGASESLFGAIQAGAEQIVYAGGDEMMQVRSQGVPLVNFATYYQTYPVVLVVPDESPIRTAADLADRSVGVPGPYGQTWFGLLALLEQAGLTQDDVQVKHIGYTQQAALTANQVDAVMGYVNNDAVRLEAAGVGVRTLPITPGDPLLVGIGLSTTDAYLRDHRDTLQKVQESVAMAVADIKGDPVAAVTLSAKYVPGLGAEPQRQSALATLNATIPLFGADSRVGHQAPATWEAMSIFMDRMGLLARPVTADECFTREIVV